MRIGFVGLGRMGRAMARNLAAAGHEVIAWNRTPPAGGADESGWQRAGTAAQALVGDMVISMLADDRAVADVFLDRNLIASMYAGQAHINMATISVALAKRLQSLHDENGSRYVSAPVFGRPEAARSRQLYVVAAGDQAAIEGARPVFDALAQRVFNLGADAYKANVAKLCGNLLVAMAMEGLAEAVNLARRHGLDGHALLDVLVNSVFSTPVYRGYGAQIAAQRYEPPQLTMLLGLKDLELMLAAARESGTELPSAELIRTRVLRAIDLGLGAKDWSAVAELFTKDA